MEKQITIMGKPITKKRPRFFRRGDFVGTYNEQETEEGRWMLEVKQYIDAQIPAGTPIALRCYFYFEIPKSMSKKRRAAAMHTSRPDLDNLVKFVKDCLNGLAWHDDSQVVSLIAKKFYDHEDRGARSVIIIATG